MKIKMLWILLVLLFLFQAAFIYFIIFLKYHLVVIPSIEVNSSIEYDILLWSTATAILAFIISFVIFKKGLNKKYSVLWALSFSLSPIILNIFVFFNERDNFLSNATIILETEKAAGISINKVVNEIDEINEILTVAIPILKNVYYQPHVFREKFDESYWSHSELDSVLTFQERSELREFKCTLPVIPLDTSGFEKNGVEKKFVSFDRVPCGAQFCEVRFGGFTKNKQKAVVTIRVSYCMECDKKSMPRSGGYEDIYILEKRRGKWVVILVKDLDLS